MLKVKQFYMYLWGKDGNITSVNVYNFQSVRIMRVFSPVIDVNFYSNKVSFFFTVSNRLKFQSFKSVEHLIAHLKKI